MVSSTPITTALIIVPATLGRSGRTRRRKRLILRANATYLTHLFQGIGRMDDQGHHHRSLRHSLTQPLLLLRCRTRRFLFQRDIQCLVASTGRGDEAVQSAQGQELAHPPAPQSPVPSMIMKCAAITSRCNHSTPSGDVKKPPSRTLPAYRPPTAPTACCGARSVFGGATPRVSGVDQGLGAHPLRRLFQALTSQLIRHPWRTRGGFAILLHGRASFFLCLGLVSAFKDMKKSGFRLTCLARATVGRGISRSEPALPRR